jgi:hypothetical protein
MKVIPGKGDVMSRLCRWFALLAMAACLSAAAAGENTVSAQPAGLRFEPHFILAAVARRMNVTLRPEIPVPAIFFESSTPLRQFQDAIGPQWRFRPHLFGNASVVARTEIYLIDDAGYYARSGRTLDDSLAHEFAHYVQVRYLDANLEDPTLESDAVAIQHGFRTEHMYPQRAEAGR